MCFVPAIAYTCGHHSPESNPLSGQFTLCHTAQVRKISPFDCPWLKYSPIQYANDPCPCVGFCRFRERRDLNPQREMDEALLVRLKAWCEQGDPSLLRPPRRTISETGGNGVEESFRAGEGQEGTRHASTKAEEGLPELLAALSISQEREVEEDELRWLLATLTLGE